MENEVMNSGAIMHLISACDKQNIKIQLTPDEQLKISAPNGKIDKELILQIKQKKDELIDFLRSVGRKSSFEEILSAAHKPFYDVSPAQRRLWILSQFKENKSNFHIPAAFTFEGQFKKDILKKTFTALAERHEILRTTFASVHGEPKQVICPIEKFEFDIDIHDIRDHKNREQEAQRIARQEASNSFDLAKGPLFRVSVIQLRDDQFILLFIMHHIISDGWSMKILLRDLQNLYAAFDLGQSPELAPLRIQYKDYTQWLNQQLSGEK
ncbi:MAG: condensation domain-containing protein, partial [Bacteroidota bacterium]